MCGWAPLDISNRLAQASQVICKAAQRLSMFTRLVLSKTVLLTLPFTKTEKNASLGSLSPQFPLGHLFHGSFLSGTGLIAWKTYIIPQMCLKACAGWEESLPSMRRNIFSRTSSRLQMMGFLVGVV